MIKVGKTSHFKFKFLEKNEMFTAEEVLAKIDQSNSHGDYLIQLSLTIWWPYTPNTECQLLFRDLGPNCDPRVCFCV